MKFGNYLLRLLNKDDVHAYFDLVDSNRPRLEDFFSGTVAKNKTVEDTRVFIKEVTANAEKKIYYPFVIVDTLTQNLVGYIDIKSISWSIPKAEIGFFIDAQYEGKGIITQGLAQIVQHCFEELAMRKLLVRTHEKNTGSRKVAERNGFELEGIIRSDYKTTSGVIVDLMYYGLLNNSIA